jgi:hypothetical protein
MGLISSIKQKLVGREVASNREDAMLGKLGGFMKSVWTILDGWKSWIVAVVAVYKLACHDCGGAGYAVAAIHALGWDTVTAAFDPAQALAAGLVIVALGHRVVKAVRQYRAGVPMEYVNTNTGAILEVEKTKAQG